MDTLPVSALEPLNCFNCFPLMCVFHKKAHWATHIILSNFCIASIQAIGFLSSVCAFYTHSFIHSFIRPFLERPFKSSTTQRHSRLQHGYCIGVSRRSAQATEGKGLAQGPYMAARAGVEPTTLRLKAIDSPRHHHVPRIACVLYK